VASLTDIISDLVSSYSRQKQALDQMTDSYKQAALAGRTQELAIYQQQKAVEQSAHKFKALSDTLNGFHKKVDQAGTAMVAIAAAGNPTLWASWTDSLKLVTMQLSSFLTPAILDGITDVQNFAKWLHDLDPVTKATITQFATMAAGAIVGTKAFELLTNKTTLLIAAFVSLYWAAQKFEGWFNKHFKDIESEAAGKQFTRKELEQSPEFKEIQGMGGDKGKIGKFLDERLAAIKKIQAEQIEATKSPIPGVEAFNRWANRQQLAELQKRINEVEQLKQWAVEGIKPPEQVAGPNKALDLNIENFWKEQMDKLVAPALGKLGIGAKMGDIANVAKGAPALHYPKELSPGFSAIEQARKQFQLAAFKDPLEQELFRKQREQAAMYIQEWQKRVQAYDAMIQLARNMGFG
jgi:hypothetical protein